MFTPLLPACLQIDVSYNLPDPVSKPAFQLKVDLKEPYQERHLQPPSSTSSSSSSSSSSPRHPSSRPRSRADNRSELNRKRRAPIDDDDPAAHQDKMDFQIYLEVCARLGKNYRYKKKILCVVRVEKYHNLNVSHAVQVAPLRLLQHGCHRSSHDIRLPGGCRKSRAGKKKKKTHLAPTSSSASPPGGSGRIITLNTRRRTRMLLLAQKLLGRRQVNTPARGAGREEREAEQIGPHLEAIC